MLATIGRGAAVAKIGPIKASGVLAWLLWLFIHIYFLIGFRNRLIVMIHWAWLYVTFDRGARLITEPLKQPSAPVVHFQTRLRHIPRSRARVEWRSEQTGEKPTLS